MIGAFRLRTLIALALLSLAGAVFAEETARWLAAADEAKPYAAIAPRLAAIAETVAASGVNERLFLDRLIEGVRKRASADRLVKAMEEEAGRLIFVAKELDISGIRLTAESREHVLSAGALSLRGSISREEFIAAVKKVALKGGSIDRLTTTITALSSADPARVVDHALRLELVDAIAGSAVKTDRLDSIAAVFARGRSFGLSPDRIARIVVNELSAGGSLTALDAALNRERGHR